MDIAGNYDAYLRFRENEKENNIEFYRKNTVVNEYKLKKEKASNERKRKTKIARIETEIEEKENLIKETEDLLSQPEVTANYEELIRLTELLDTSRIELEDLYSQWEILQIEE